MCDRINVQVHGGWKEDDGCFFKSYDLDGEIRNYARGIIIPEVHAEKLMGDRNGLEPVKGKEEIVERFIARCRLKGIFPHLRIKEK